ncbi:MULTISPECIES: CPBP family intramembrane glutamic endopeptidase [unclassified Flavobacterium]|uniref:CPBP family intramembrane glutamic endopeptidase n=1 Tax=unclassified Flavobacterium TaxID=196869 RepID=UPI0012925EF0|nr:MULTISPECIES: type II CAAX endopeptidase family protein [unclassified Flavobacterium]MQP52859.1 CPBP family intramembrane metalloprotease [Flavobacterium sp. LMO9]MQP63133.1 CPBP family intramembrane metalloprotease [Flavobacterium sp. LMO6]
MYIEQLKKSKNNVWSYLPLPLGFILLMFSNFLLSDGVDTNEIINQYIRLLGVNLTFVLLVAPLAIGLLLVLFWTKIIQGISLTSLTTSRSKIDWKRVFFSFFLWGSITTIMILALYYSQPENFEWNFQPEKFFIFLILAIILIPMQTSFEEYLFRAHMMQGIGLATNSRLIPLLVTSILFGLMHIANPEVGKIGYIIMVYYIGTGFFLGIMTLMDEGLELALGFHAANNLVGALLLTADWTAFQTNSILKDVSEPSTGFDVLLPIFIIFPTLLFIFSKVYKWNNWKEKLTGKLVEINIED